MENRFIAVDTKSRKSSLKYSYYHIYDKVEKKAIIFNMIDKIDALKVCLFLNSVIVTKKQDG